MKYRLKKDCLHHLRDTFGLTDYRPGQKEAAYALLSGRDVMCILPTGAGKSLCWQLPAVVYEGVTLVVSPLIALMRDQVQHLNNRGIPAVSLDSLMSPAEKADAVARLTNGQVRIVFVSPERLAQESFRRLCCQVQPWLMVVDEAHCMVQWGDGFRPAYQGIAEFVQMLPKRPVLCALTATADSAMQRSICRMLRLYRPKKLLMPILRENLAYEVRTTLDCTRDIQRMIGQAPCKTLVFCRSRSRTESLADTLRAAGVPADCYHAGLERQARMDSQQRFLDGRTSVLCATSAFGLGVDIPDVRRVVHEYLPEHLIDYVQQTGRAGRDGARAECVLLFSPNDLIAKNLVRQRCRDKLRGKPVRRWLYLRRYWYELRRVMTAVLVEECIPRGLARAMGQRQAACGQCSACRNGRLMDAVPSFMHMKEWQIRAWILAWQRDVLASRRGCRPSEILSDHALNAAAQRFVLPEDAGSVPELERILLHFRRMRPHDSDESGI